ncbi:P-loop containing nucleoside triphosphate hydrolase protein [Trichoderma barbatum]
MSSSSAPDKSGQGLGNRVLLDKVDKLRELGISHLVPLPQMVVVGDQSAGKSSVLESLTGFQFPRSATLCTRHATKIVCRREPAESVVVSIIPQSLSTEREKLIRDFRLSTDKIHSDDFPQMFEDAAKAMGIKLSQDDGDGGGAFGLDVLKVEISGPDALHLTVIDVPGMYETVTPGLTTESGIDMVKNMVKRYIHESRTIILAVADPQGKRTLGVLTKPDLAIENATRAVTCDLVDGKRRDLHLGYCVVKDLGADDTSGSMDSRHQQELSLFGQAPWNSLPSDKLGTPALCNHIKRLLMDRTRADLKKNQGLLADMGEPRNTTDQQRAFVGKIASRFMRIKKCGLDANYTGNSFFKDAEMRLMTRMRAINDAFSRILLEMGHATEIDADAKRTEEKKQSANDEGFPQDDEWPPQGPSSLYDEKIRSMITSLHEESLSDTVLAPYWCSKPGIEGLLEYIKARGYDTRTLNAAKLVWVFEGNHRRWPLIACAHIFNAMLIVHRFVQQALQECCPDDTAREKLWAFLLYSHDDHDGLRRRYERAAEHVDFLLTIVFEYPIFMNPHFEEKLEQLNPRLCRVVDEVCRQAIDYYLLDAENGPLAVLSDDVVLNMTAEQLEVIAERLTKEVESLTQALKILTG